MPWTSVSDLHDRGLVARAMAEIGVQRLFDLAPPRKDSAAGVSSSRPGAGSSEGEPSRRKAARWTCKDLVEPLAGFDHGDGVHGSLRWPGATPTFNLDVGIAVPKRLDEVTGGLHFRASCVARGASRLSDDKLVARARDFEAMARFAQFPGHGYRDRSIIGKSGREAHRRTGLAVRNRRDDPMAVIFAGEVDDAMKTAEIDTFARQGGQFAGMQGRCSQPDCRQAADEVARRGALFLSL